MNPYPAQLITQTSLAPKNVSIDVLIDHSTMPCEPALLWPAMEAMLKLTQENRSNCWTNGRGQVTFRHILPSNNQAKEEAIARFATNNLFSTTGSQIPVGTSVDQFLDVVSSKNLLVVTNNESYSPPMTNQSLKDKKVGLIHYKQSSTAFTKNPLWVMSTHWDRFKSSIDPISEFRSRIQESEKIENKAAIKALLYRSEENLEKLYSYCKKNYNVPTQAKILVLEAKLQSLLASIQSTPLPTSPSNASSSSSSSSSTQLSSPFEILEGVKQELKDLFLQEHSDLSDPEILELGLLFSQDPESNPAFDPGMAYLIFKSIEPHPNQLDKLYYREAQLQIANLLIKGHLKPVSDQTDELEPRRDLSAPMNSKERSLLQKMEALYISRGTFTQPGTELQTLMNNAMFQYATEKFLPRPIDGRIPGAILEVLDQIKETHDQEIEHLKKSHEEELALLKKTYEAQIAQLSTVLK